MMRCVIPSLFTACAALGGCSGEPVEPATDAQITVISEDGPVRVRVGVDADRMRTVDSLAVRVELVVAPTVPPPLLSMDFASGGWRVERETIAPPLIDADGMVVREHLWVVSPDLAGAYQVPAALVVWTDAAGERRELLGSPISIEVVSVLEPGDDLRLEPPTPAPVPAPTLTPTPEGDG
ncbi:MAG: hypothetical protein AAF356_01160 [Planctomycetota bacterium]